MKTAAINYFPFVLFVLFVAIPVSAPHAQTVSTQKLCVLSGLGDVRALSQPNVKLYGTDLGITYARNNKLEVLFGDTWATDTAAPPNPLIPRDDAYGTIDLLAFPDGDAVEARCNQGAGSAPPIVYGTASSTTIATLNPGVAMDGLKTPVAAFTTSPQSTSREFAIFVTGKPVACANNSECGGYTCDTGLGYTGTAPNDTGPGLTLPCIDGSSSCTNQTKFAFTPTGFCRDPGSSVATPLDDIGRKSSVVIKQKVGVRSTASPRNVYTAKDWVTSRFINPSIATVNNFDPSRANGVGNDYATADGVSTSTEKVFIWGRPWWNSLNSLGHNLHMYVAYVDMPTVNSSGSFAWQPKYFTGMDTAGRPQFSTNPLQAAPLDLSGGSSNPAEQYDIVAQMSIRWIPALNKWVMFYGGGTQLSEAICSVPGANCELLNLAGAAVRMRTAAHPWGPWSLPQDVLVGGDPRNGAVEQYAPGGIMRHPACTAPTCAPHSAPLAPSETGALYGANLIEQWTETRANGAVDLYWNVSTWDPYRVMLMKTRITP